MSTPIAQEPDSGNTGFNQQNQTVQAQTNIAGTVHNAALNVFVGSFDAALRSPDPSVLQQFQDMLRLMFSPGAINEDSLGSIQNYRPRGLGDLFSVITDFKEIPAALFNTDPAPGITPYQVDYVNGRENVNKVQEALQHVVRKSGGRLLIQGRSGIGKTREIAELAKDWCERGWVVCVAKNEDGADERLDALAAFPQEFSDAKLLVILDNLHLRVAQREKGQLPYIDRLERLLSFLENAAGSLFVIGIAPSEPKYQKLLGYDPAHTLWQRFSIYELPEFSVGGLRQILESMASQANIPIEDIEGLITNSDRKPATIVENIKLARIENRPLNKSTWKPTRDSTWQEAVSGVQKRYPETSYVYQALYLLHKIGVTPRMAYVLQLSTILAGKEIREAIDSLLDMGLLGRRGKTITVFSQEQLEESLEALGKSDLDVSRFIDEILVGIREIPQRPDHWLDDLISLTFRFLQLGDHLHAKEIADLAIQNGSESAQAYLARGMAQFMQTNWSASESDMSLAIERSPEEPQLYKLRGSVRNILGDFEGLIADMDAAIRYGQEEAITYANRAWARYNQGDNQLAIADFSMALEKSDTGDNSLAFGNQNGPAASSFCYLMRGCLRYQLQDFAGSEADLTMVLERGLSWNYLDALPAMANGDWSQFLEKFEDPGATDREKGNGWIYGLRSIIRIRLGKYEEAEFDVTRALKSGLRTFVNRLDSMRELEIPGIAKALKNWNAMHAQFQGNFFEASLYYVRGLCRGNQQRYAEAEEDFDDALKAGLQDTDVYVRRGVSRFAQGKHSEAEEDYSFAISHGKDEAQPYLYRGIVRLNQHHHAEAEMDFNKAIERDKNNAEVYFWRGLSSHVQMNMIQAEEDYNFAINLGKKEAQLYFQRGVVRQSLQRYADAEEDFNKAIECGQDNADVYFWRGTSRAALKKATEAEADFLAAAARGLNNAALHLYLGSVRQSLRREEEAKADFEAAQALGTNDSDYYMVRAEQSIGQQNFIQAEQDLKTAMGKGGDTFYIHYLSGIVHIQLNQWLEAESDLTASLERNPEHADSYYLRSTVRHYLNRLEEAEQDINLAFEKGRHDVYAYSKRSGIRLDLGRSAASEMDADEAIKLGMADAGIYLVRGEARRQQGKNVEAEEDFDLAIERGIDNADIYYRRGLARAHQEKYGQAESDFDKALSDDTNEPVYYYQRARVRDLQDKYAAAEADYTEAILRGRTDANTFFARGRMRFEIDKLVEAIDDLSQAIDLGLEDNGVINLRGVTRLFLGRLAEAESDFDRSLSFTPDQSEILWLRGLCRAYSKNWTAAEADFREAIAQGKQDVAIYGAMAENAVHLDKLEEAESYCILASELDDTESSTSWTWGLINLARRDYENAILHFQKAIEAGSDIVKHADLGLAYLLDDRLVEAQNEYRMCVSEKDSLGIVDILAMKQELDFWTSKQADRLASDEAQQALHNIRQLLDTLPSI